MKYKITSYWKTSKKTKQTEHGLLSLSHCLFVCFLLNFYDVRIHGPDPVLYVVLKISWATRYFHFCFSTTYAFHVAESRIEDNPFKTALRLLLSILYILVPLTSPRRTNVCFANSTILSNGKRVCGRHLTDVIMLLSCTSLLFVLFEERRKGFFPFSFHFTISIFFSP